jgi:LmbE family N-acetylglucosaminyl deacetylase
VVLSSIWTREQNGRRDVKKTITVIMAHADDIELYAGATLAKYIADGYRALYGVLSRCNSGWTVTEEKGGHYISSLEIIPQRRAEAGAAARVFGAEFHYGDLLENCYTTRDGVRIIPSYTGPAGVSETAIDKESIATDDLPEGTLFSTASGAGEPWEGHPVIREVADLLIAWEPELVIGQGIGNLNPDHFAAAQIVSIAWQVASREAQIGPYLSPVTPPRAGRLKFPPLTPERFVDVSGHEETCLRALACHRSQGGHLPSRHEARRRSWGGWREQSGLEAAEAFAVIHTPEDLAG